MELAKRLWLLPPMAVTAAEASAEAEDVELIRFITNFTYKVVKKREKPSPCVETNKFERTAKTAAVGQTASERAAAVRAAAEGRVSGFRE